MLFRSAEEAFLIKNQESNLAIIKDELKVICMGLAGSLGTGSRLRLQHAPELISEGRRQGRGRRNEKGLEKNQSHNNLNAGDTKGSLDFPFHYDT